MKKCTVGSGLFLTLLNFYITQAYWPFNSFSAPVESTFKADAKTVLLNFDQIRRARHAQDLLRLKIEQCRDDINFKATKLNELNNAFDRYAVQTKESDEQRALIVACCAQGLSGECAQQIKKIKEIYEQKQKASDDFKKQRELLFKEIQDAHDLIGQYTSQIDLIDQKIADYQKQEEEDHARQQTIDCERQAEQEQALNDRRD